MAVIRNKQHLTCLRTFDGALVLETMYYSEEVRRPEQLEGDLSWREADPRGGELELAKSLVLNLASDFEPSKYDDRYREELLEVIHTKAEGEVVDLMQALRESVERTQRQRSRKAS